MLCLHVEASDRCQRTSVSSERRTETGAPPRTPSKASLSLSLSPHHNYLPPLSHRRVLNDSHDMLLLSLTLFPSLSLALYSLSSRQSVTLCASRSPPADRLTRSSTAGDDPFSLRTISYTGPRTTNSIPFPTVVRGANMLPRVCTVPSSPFSFPSRCCFPPLVSPLLSSKPPALWTVAHDARKFGYHALLPSFLSPHAHRPAWRYDAVFQSMLATGGNRKKKKKR